MREILFRGKRVDDGEWVCGNSIIMLNNSEADKPYDMAIFDEHWQLWQTVDLETVGQYTGLKDKNGKKIFEGDIVQYQPNYMSEPIYSVVEYCADKYNYPAFDLKKHDYEANGLQCAHEEGIGCEVIGNIFDNLELLGVEK